MCIQCLSAECGTIELLSASKTINGVGKVSDQTNSANWTLQKTILCLVWGGFALVLGDIRIEHNQVLIEMWQAWIPVVFSLAMLVLIPLGIFRWRNAGRKLLLVCFLVSTVVGGAGAILHMKEKPAEAIQHVLSIWAQQPGVSPQVSVTGNSTSGTPKRREHWPPLLAPLAFAGLGLIGMAACWQFAQATAEST